jgi:ribosomal protein S18 acetylase RimI-like enzyme
MDTRTADIRVLAPCEAHYSAALRNVVSGQSAPDVETDRRVADLLDFVQSRPLTLEPVVGGFADGRLICACACVESPGRAALVHVPPDRIARRHGDVLAAALRTLLDRAWARSLVVVQALVPPDSPNLETTLSRAGFRFLAELVYQERAVEAPPGARHIRTDLTFAPYSGRTHGLFIDAMNLSYVDSLDCPGLAGLRDTEDVLAAHRAAGAHNPECWFVAMDGRQPVGVILLSKLLRRPVMEVVYMGVAAGARGQKVGDALLARAVEQCASCGATRVALAVDSTNRPAVRLYARWGFDEIARRRAWIAARADPERP